MSLSQIPLKISLNDHATFDNFYPGDNQVAVSLLKQFCISGSEPFIYLWGGPGTGRSHLLQACAHHHHTNKQPSFYFSCEQLELAKPEAFESLEQMNLICLDNINSLLGKPSWEEALFHLYNRMRASQKKLLVSSSCSPTHLTCQLADLKSRLSWGPIFQIKPLTDEQKTQALLLRLHNRGLTITPEAAHFLLHHTARDLPAMFNNLNKLDTASLAHQRRLTIPFIKDVLGI